MPDGLTLELAHLARAPQPVVFRLFSAADQLRGPRECGLQVETVRQAVGLGLQGLGAFDE